MMKSGIGGEAERRFLKNFTALSGRLMGAPTVAETLNTQVLIERVQQNDPEALNQLCERYLMRVLAAVRMRLGAKLRRKLESGDIVQAVMMDALKVVKTFDYRTEGGFLKYLNLVVENKIRDQADRWAAQKRNQDLEVPLERRSPLTTIPLEIPEGNVRTPSSIAALREDLERLEVAMERLADESAEYRDLIIAVKIEGQSYAEIAEESGTTPDAVRMKAKRAVLAITRIYQEMDAGEAKP